MKGERVCPYFGKSDDLCDMGCGPASAHDVGLMVRHCSATYGECTRFQLLRDRERQPEFQSLRRGLVSEVSHQIRTPLTSIRSCSEILLRYDLHDPERSRRFVKIIHEEAERLSRAMEDLLDAAEPAAEGP